MLRIKVTSHEVQFLNPISVAQKMADVMCFLKKEEKEKENNSFGSNLSQEYWLLNQSNRCPLKK